MPVRKAERLLLDWVNLPQVGPDLKNAGHGAYRRLYTLYPEVFAEEFGFDAANEESLFQFLRFTFGLRTFLRKTWDAPDLYHRDWYLHQLEALCHQFRTEHAADNALAKVWGHGAAMQEAYQSFLGRLVEPPSEVTHSQAAIYHLRRNIGRACHCPNPDCSNPFFLAAKKRQKFCSTVCARPAQLEAKRRWWSEHRAHKVRSRKET